MLRQLLPVLRRGLGEDAFLTRGDPVGLNSDRIETDGAAAAMSHRGPSRDALRQGSRQYTPIVAPLLGASPAIHDPFAAIRCAVATVPLVPTPPSSCTLVLS